MQPSTIDLNTNKLWNRIYHYQMNNPETKYVFTKKLSSENKWTTEFSLKATLEYKKFIFLVCLSHDSTTPSPIVDKVWHLHLLFTKAYWKDFCPRILQKEIHHTPGAGGETEQKAMIKQYTHTTQLYTKVFKEAPPKNIWPSSNTMFKESFYSSDFHFKRWMFYTIL